MHNNYNKVYDFGIFIVMGVYFGDLSAVLVNLIEEDTL